MFCWFLIFIKNHETAIHTHLPYTLFTQCSFLGICWGDINILLDFWILLNLDLPCVRPNWQYKLLVQDYNSLRWYKTFWELFPFEVMWLCNKVTVFMSQNMNLWNVTVVTFLRLCVPIGDYSTCVDKKNTSDFWRCLKNVNNFWNEMFVLLYPPTLY